MDSDEIATHATELGCHDEADANTWGKIVFAQTSGHPKLVHVRLKELSEAKLAEANR